MKTIKRTSIRSVISLVLAGYIGSVSATYYPNAGDLYYNGQYYLDAYMIWQSPGPWTAPSPDAGYEHDLWVQDPAFFTSTCTSATNLPASYDDCPTAGVFDPNGPVFSFGTFDGRLLSPNRAWFGAWGFSFHGMAHSSGFSLIGQENENVCPFGVDGIWCRFSVNSEPLITGYYMNWQGYPAIINY